MRPRRLQLVRGPDGRVCIGIGATVSAVAHAPPSRRAMILPVIGARPLSSSCTTRASVAKRRAR